MIRRRIFNIAEAISLVACVLGREKPLKIALVICAAAIGFGCHAGQQPAPRPRPEAQQTQPDRATMPFVMVGDSFTASEVVLSDNGQAIIATEPYTDSSQMRASMWDVSTVRRVGTPLPFVWDYGLSADGKIAFTVDKTLIHVFDVATSTSHWTTEFNSAPVEHVGISADGTEIIASSESDKSVKLWHVGSDKPRLTIKLDYVSTEVDFDPTGKRIAIREGSWIHICDAHTGNVLVRELAVESKWGGLRHLFDPTGQYFLELDNGVAQVVDIATGNARVQIKFEQLVAWARWSADSDKILVWVFENMTGQIYDAATGKLERTIDRRDRNDLECLCVMPGSRWAVVARVRKPLEVVDLTTGRTVQTLGDSQHIICEPRGSTLVTEDVNQMKRIWKLRKQ